MSIERDIPDSKNEVTTEKSFFLLSSLTIVEKIVGFLLQAAIAAVMGATIITDCYYATFELTMLIDQSLVTAIIVILLKQYSEKLVREGAQPANEMLSNMRMLIIPFMLILSLGIFCFSGGVSYLLAPSYDEASREILIKNIRLLAFLPAINAFGAFYLVILRQKKKFLIVGLKSLFINIFVFIGLFVNVVLKIKSSTALCIAYNIALVFYGITAFISSKKDARLRIKKPTITDDFRQLIKLILPLVVSNGIVRISLIVDRIIASMMEEGSVTCLTYAHMLSYFVEGVFIINISTIILSDLVNLVACSDNTRIREKLYKAMSSMILLLLPITIITVLYSKEISSIVFQHGNFTENDVNRVAGLIAVYSIGFIPSAISNILMQTHYAYGKTKKTLIITIISIASNIVISIALSMKIGLKGIAIGTVCAYILSATLYYINCRKIVGLKRLTKNEAFFRKTFFGAIICTGIVVVIHTYCHFGALPSFAFATLMGGAAYILCLAVLREETVLYYLGKLKK